MKRILLLTNYFPYNQGENFIEAELDYIPSDINVTIIPTRLHNLESLRKLSSNRFSVNNIFAKKKYLYYFLAVIKSIFLKEFYEELFEIKKREKISVSVIKRVIGYFSRSIYTCELLSKEYHKEFKSGNLTIYSYWFLESSLAAAYLNKKFGCKVYCRAHGVDVWDGASVYGIAPAREFVLKHITELYVCSKAGAKFIADKYSMYSKKIKHGYLGTIDYGYKVIMEKNPRFKVVSCSRMVPIKRIDLLVDALLLLKKYSIEWIHFGDGPEFEKIKSKCNQFDSNISVNLMGNVSHNTVMEYYKNNHVDLFVNTSSTEGVPVSIMEAISFGIPIIATDVGGTNEIVCSQTGVLVEKDISANLLAQEIEKVITMDLRKYSIWRNSAREYWCNNFSAKTNYEEFYAKITS